jgi:hypothetical protein
VSAATLGAVVALLAAGMVYLPALDSSGKLLQHPRRGERCWRLASCAPAASGWSGAVVCSTRGSSSEAQQYLRKHRAGSCALGSEVK